MKEGDPVKVLDCTGKGPTGVVIAVEPSGESNKLTVQFEDGTHKVYRNFELSLLPNSYRSAA